MSIITLQVDVSKRESQFELIRILAQFFIIVYHIYLFFIYPVTNNPFHKAIWLPLHVGVILFILISGWFGIKTNVKSFVRLITMMALLYFPLQLMWIIKEGVNSTFELFTIPFFITWSPFWFMRTYVFLFLLAPFLNFYLENALKRQKIYLLFVLFVISYYVGSWGADSSLSDGKNVITFAFLYTLGHFLREYRDKLRRISSRVLLSMYILYNITIVTIFSFPNAIPGAGFLYERVFFSYCSVGLLINAVMLFLLLSRLKFSSRVINIVGGASLTMYMLHSANIIMFNLIGPHVVDFVTSFYQINLYSEAVLLFKVALLACFIMIISVGVHYALFPIAIKLSSSFPKK